MAILPWTLWFNCNHCNRRNVSFILYSTDARANRLVGAGLDMFKELTSTEDVMCLPIYHLDLTRETVRGTPHSLCYNITITLHIVDFKLGAPDPKLTLLFTEGQCTL